MFAKIRQFITSQPVLLSTQLSKLEGNIDKALDDLTAATLRSFEQLPRATKANATPLGVGQLGEFDPTGGGIRVTLDRPTRAVTGFAAIVCRATAAALTVVVAPPAPGGTQGKINNSSSVNIAAAGLKLVYSDGQDWWMT